MFQPLKSTPEAPKYGPKDHIKIRILHTMVSGICLVLGLKIRM